MTLIVAYTCHVECTWHVYARNLLQAHSKARVVQASHFYFPMRNQEYFMHKLEYVAKYTVSEVSRARFFALSCKSELHQFMPYT